MEKRLHNTRHAARQARNTAGTCTTRTATAVTTPSSNTTASIGAAAATATTISTTAAAAAEDMSSRHHPQRQEQTLHDSSDDEEEEQDDEQTTTSPSESPPPSTTMTTTTPAPSAVSTSPTSTSSSPEQMYNGFQSWALRTYGDSAKTKTVTRKKYQRILKILKGEEQTSAENSKFRFWVKAKGFKMGLPPGHVPQAHRGVKPSDQVLFVPCSKLKKGSEGETTVYKRVAVVENFFDIIYGVHVEMDGRGGKHAGQKRTYKAIAELYAFLPREAVTHFLMSCSDCQKRMHLTNGCLTGVTSTTTTNNNNGGGATPELASPGYPGNACATPGSAPLSDVISGGACGSGAISTSSPESSPDGDASGDGGGDGGALGACVAETGTTPAVIAAELDFSVPITTAYLKHMRSLGLSDGDALNHKEDSTFGSDDLSDEDGSPNYDDDDSPDTCVDAKEEDDVAMAEGGSAPGSDAEHGVAPTRKSGASPREGAGGLTSAAPSTTALGDVEGVRWSDQQPLNMTSRLGADQAYDRTLSPPATHQGGEHTPDDLSASTKEEDEEDDDDEQDKLDINSYDPERLKAFNMFVRLFVDENLDRMVPISRQPKEKIQAIIDSCSRQFPEFSERSRKRIRTYLKSCRRTKRTRDLNGWDGRAAVPHLTSPLAEQILASACENETNNAKRMRLGLQPLVTDSDGAGRSTTPNFHPAVGVTPSHSSISTPVAVTPTTNVSSQLISRLTSPIISSTPNGNAMAVTVATANPVTTSNNVEVTTVCPFHLHHHHQQFHHQLHNNTTSANIISSSNAVSTTNGTVVVTATPATVTSFMNGTTTPHTHTHHHHNCFAGGTGNNGSVSNIGNTTNGHHYHTHHRHLAVSTGNGPTDLSVKKCAGNGTAERPTALKYSLNPTEVNAVKQLIAGYRESAAFLLRSADELEQLLLQQN